jgi:hypothetical protein
VYPHRPFRPFLDQLAVNGFRQPIDVFDDEADQNLRIHWPFIPKSRCGPPSPEVGEVAAVGQSGVRRGAVSENASDFAQCFGVEDLFGDMRATGLDRYRLPRRLCSTVLAFDILA